MSCRIRLYDQINQNMIYKGYASSQPSQNKVVLTFGDEEHSFIWKIYHSALIIESISDIHVFLILKENVRTAGHIDSEFGRIDIQCETSQLSIKNHSVKVKYAIVNGEDKQDFMFTMMIDEGEDLCNLLILN